MTEPIPEWEVQYDENWGSGDESGDFPSSAIKTFIRDLLKRERVRAEERGKIKGRVEAIQYVRAELESGDGSKTIKQVFEETRSPHREDKV